MKKSTLTVSTYEFTDQERDTLFNALTIIRRLERNGFTKEGMIDALHKDNYYVPLDWSVIELALASENLLISTRKTLDINS